MQMCRSLRLWYSVNCPPPLPLNDDGGKCEFTAGQCKAKIAVKLSAVQVDAVLLKHAQEEKYREVFLGFTVAQSVRSKLSRGGWMFQGQSVR